ncbi:MAG TPA: hypothetical protein VIY51_02195 [Xanthobacteraceae bacterium]
MTGNSGMKAGVAVAALLLGSCAMLGSASAAALLVPSTLKLNPVKSAAVAVPFVPAKILVVPAAVPANRVPLGPTLAASQVKLLPPTVVTAKAPPPVPAAVVAPSKVVPPGPAGAAAPSKPLAVQVGAVASSRTYQIGFNGQVDTATEVTIEPTATTKGSVTTILKTPGGQVVKTSTVVCPIGWACGQAPTAAVLAANPSGTTAVPAPTQPATAVPSPTAGGIAGEAATLGITPAQLQILISGPKKGDPTVIKIPNEHIAQPSGVTCMKGVVATYGGNQAVNPGGTLNGRPYTGPAGVVGGWVSTCA